ncbi:MAG: tetraacyldisaccharide 4'-kinase [Chlamydiota bacterium]|nr:tetraacyldisaccharide 4'-kinase [Chlamydiota bacterium]
MMGSPPHPLSAPFLFPLSFLFRWGVAFRHLLFRWRIKKTRRAPIPVISIGNIHIGGTGKTPLTALLAKELLRHSEGAILSRGRNKIAGNSLFFSAEDCPVYSRCGDEIRLLADQIPNCQYGVGKDRLASARRAKEKGCRWVLLDDGMQCLSLSSDFSLIILPCDDPLGKKGFLPFGPLRDHPQRLSKADAIFVNGTPCDLSPIRQYTDAPLIGCSMVPRGIRWITPNGEGDIRGKRVGTFCGLGRPRSFLNSIVEWGSESILHHSLYDHQAISKEPLLRFSKKAKEKGAHAIICSQKDAVKLPPSPSSLLPIGYLISRLEITQNLPAWQELIHSIQDNITR